MQTSEQPLSQLLLPPLILSLLLTTSLAALSGYVYTQLPADARVPTHWNIHGQPDQYAGPASLFIMPGVLLGLSLLLAGIPFVEPRRQNLLHSWKAYRAIWISVVLLLTALGCGINATALGYRVPIAHVALIGIASLFLVIGRTLGQMKSTYFVGVRTPWTLTSEESWSKTNRLVGRLFFLGGAALLALTFTGATPLILFVTLLTFTALIVLTTLFYSWYTWRQDPHRTP